jgi:hypothetical protein
VKRHKRRVPQGTRIHPDNTGVCRLPAPQQPVHPATLSSWGCLDSPQHAVQNKMPAMTCPAPCADPPAERHTAAVTHNSSMRCPHPAATQLHHKETQGCPANAPLQPQQPHKPSSAPLNPTTPLPHQQLRKNPQLAPQGLHRPCWAAASMLRPVSRAADPQHPQLHHPALNTPTQSSVCRSCTTQPYTLWQRAQAAPLHPCS